MGLAVSQSIIRDHNGEISFESGANGVLELPDGSILAAGLCAGRGGHAQTFGLVRFKGGSTAVGK